MSQTSAHTRLDTLFLSEPDMIAAGVTDMPACVDTMEEVFRCLSVEDYRMAGKNNNSHGAMVVFPESSPHPQMPLDATDRRFMAMPAYLGGSFHRAGVKWYGSNVENRNHGLPRSIHMFVLNDAVTGAPLSIMSANLLSSYRTGAISGVGARYLAREDAKVVSIIGPGVMGKTALEAFVAARPGLNTLKVKGRGADSLRSFIAWVKETLPQFTTIITAETIEEAVRDSDIVSVCSTAAAGSANYPMIEAEWIKAGALITAPGCANFNNEYLSSGKVRMVVDNRGLYEAWLEEYSPQAFEDVGIIGVKFLQMEQDGDLTPGIVTDIGQIITNEKPARTSEEEVIIFSVGGMPVEDVAWASYVYDRARELGIGTWLNIWHTPELA
ncbi:ornithine cyclodeaminase [Corynebacterium sp. sy017]|uniref:tyramine oxidase subunit B n=1 Tax=unclassified Corynebacterium TaxID=2624378 RepID=UPI0011863C6C|nr:MULTISPECIES: tyramine oxidase subunit B [unclassified Corynebacterium]MBP3088154.1 ornithine cyclodeaminase [Corynebacterium sp. sy017]QDZ43091.1 ornithine cyclodeaminase [Corynebacterium sp. sy039]TSD92664.1 ornithine cyclodeaminase [Corynebacterium sp. SY003]